MWWRAVVAVRALDRLLERIKCWSRILSGVLPKSRYRALFDTARWVESNQWLAYAICLRFFARAAHKIFLYRPYEFGFKPGGGQTVDSLFSRFIELLGRQEGDPSFEQFLEGLGISYTEIDILNRKSWFFECGAHMAFSDPGRPIREYSDVIFCGQPNTVCGLSYVAFNEPFCAGITIADSRSSVRQKLNQSPKILHGMIIVSTERKQIYDYYDFDRYELEFKFPESADRIQCLTVRPLDPAPVGPRFYQR